MMEPPLFSKKFSIEVAKEMIVTNRIASNNYQNQIIDNKKKK